jgi:hypothetical protein
MRDGCPSCLTYFGFLGCCCGVLRCSSTSLSTLLASLRCKFVKKTVVAIGLGGAC